MSLGTRLERGTIEHRIIESFELEETFKGQHIQLRGNELGYLQLELSPAWADRVHLP